MSLLPRAAAFKLVVALSAALAMAACAKNPGADSLAGNGIATPGSPQDFSQNVGDRVFSETDSTELTPTAQATLDKQATWLQQYGRYNFVVEGHADERGTREYNLALGARRANAVKEYLVAQGVSAARLETISYGKERPICTESNEDCWSQNRRGVSVITGGANS